MYYCLRCWYPQCGTPAPFWISASVPALWLLLQVMEFYCESCETAMCLECTEGEHREHETVPLRDVLEQHKAALKEQLDAIRNRCTQAPGRTTLPWPVCRVTESRFTIIIK